MKVCLHLALLTLVAGENDTSNTGLRVITDSNEDEGFDGRDNNQDFAPLQKGAAHHSPRGLKTKTLSGTTKAPKAPKAKKTKSPAPSAAPSLSLVPSSTPSDVPSSQPSKCPSDQFVDESGNCVDTAAEACPTGSFPVAANSPNPAYCMACGCGFCTRLTSGSGPGVSCCGANGSFDPNNPFFSGGRCVQTVTTPTQCLASTINFPGATTGPVFPYGVAFSVCTNMLEYILDGNDPLPLSGADAINQACFCVPDSENSCDINPTAVAALSESERCFVCRSDVALNLGLLTVPANPDNPDPCYWN